MARWFRVILLISGCVVIVSCSSEKSTAPKSLFAKENLLAWCIVPYDTQERSPEERAKMLNDLGITRYAYDWRSKQLPTFADEIKSLKAHGIKLEAVWFWIDGGSGELLDGNNWLILETLRKNNVQTRLWVSFSRQFFENLSEAEKLEKGIKAVGEIHRIAAEVGCKIGLYNHGDWFGNPLNQIRIIKALGADDIGIVYNFHHAHDQINDFAGLLRKMMPYLWTVNLNGMRASGPQILPLGQGDRDLELLRALKDSRFNGTIGILGHVEDEDARVVLERNLSGLQALLEKLGDHSALRTYKLLN
jgi:hypothetical protein